MEADTEQVEASGNGRHGLQASLEQFSGYSSGDTSMPDADASLSTPHHSLDKDSAAPSITRPYSNTRSHKNQQSPTQAASIRQTPALRKLQTATKGPQVQAETPVFHGYRDASIATTRSQTIEVSDESVKAKPRKAAAKRRGSRPLRDSRRSGRGKSRHQAPPNPVESRKNLLRKSAPKPATVLDQWPRRSRRLSKPLTQFHKYPNLPPEIQLMIWKHAVSPRLVYIRNRSAPNYTHTVQTPRPAWFMTDGISMEIAARGYQNMFGLRYDTDNRTEQPVNPDVDIIVLEPCCNGCRGFFCTRNQFKDVDRDRVRFLAVQVDSANLALVARPCWETITLSFPRVETLYLMRTAPKGDQTTEKALIRVAEDDRETQLRNRFDEWKKGMGKFTPMTTLEFVVLVDKEPDSVVPKSRYSGIKERKTRTPEDVILG
ncbi:hypothetical protein AB5N19_11499 [Seiridium cardinale]